MTGKAAAITDMATVTPSTNSRTPNPPDHIKTTPSTILVAYSGLCCEAELQACQVACSPPVQRGAGPVGVQPEEVERAGHVRVVEAGFQQAAVAGAAGAVAGDLVYGALDSGAAGVSAIRPSAT
jgi:hypothetical protein